jgi:hypothetical protein
VPNGQRERKLIVQRLRCNRTRNKSLFASFSSEKEESSSFSKKLFRGGLDRRYSEENTFCLTGSEILYKQAVDAMNFDQADKNNTSAADMRFIANAPPN